MKATRSYYENFAKQSIIETLLKLMETSDFSSISITKLCQEAGIARRTFYLYYDNKYDVLDDYYRVLTREYDERSEENKHMDGLQQIEYFFDFWYQHKDYLELLYRQDLFHVLLNRFNDYLSNRAKHEDIRDLNDYSLSYSSGGLWAVLFAWTKEGFKEDRKKLASVVYGLQT